MDLYRLDKSFRRQAYVEGISSLIWTDRFATYGDIILEMPDTPKNRLNFPEGTFLSNSESREVMILETREIQNRKIKYTGVSLLAFLKNRMFRKSWDNRQGAVTFDFNPGLLPGLLVRNFATQTSANANVIVPTGYLEMIPGLRIGPEPTEYFTGSEEYAVQPGTLYDAITAICANFDLGQTLYLNEASDDGTYDLVYLSYRGRDLTTAQTANKVVQFSPAVDSLVDVRELRSIAGYKNVAYAFAPSVPAAVPYVGVAYADTDAVSALGFDRRTLMVLADDIQPEDVNLTTTAGKNSFLNILNRRARNGLINNNYVKMVDGQIVPQSQYRYGSDFNLGDTIDLLAENGTEHSHAMVTEYIYSKDDNGFSSYPTLATV